MILMSEQWTHRAKPKLLSPQATYHPESAPPCFMISDLASIVLVLSILVCLWALSSANKSHIRKLPYPPGPAPSFIWGNRNDLSAPHVWKRYAEWANEYGMLVSFFILTHLHLNLLNLGNILHLRIFNKKIIILNSLEDAVELLERRSKVYSSRPIVPMHKLYVILIPWSSHRDES